ncbi:jg7489 [Pararge aegeria aegeria]|uniref:Jg7489 protein n=1 Tax=Pararge aegeria aegeria TaxID=348720 RepID=A0A8S4R5I0_9NEOP|nr:jg7489 [Pararge aegeria aegeria]
MVMVDPFVIVILGTCFSNVKGNDYEDEEKMYLLVSPDQHTRTPRLEDFFWTGSGDGPPPPDLSVPMPTPTAPVVRTTTVLATVYLDSYPPQAVTDTTSGECVLNCEATPDSLEPDIPEDRRYWLLTVIQGSTPDSLQLRLARLYQKAFLRQQERHLGIIKSLDAPTPRKKHDVHSFVINKDFKDKDFISTNTAKTPQKFYDNQTLISLDDLAVNNELQRSENSSDAMNRSYLANIEMFSIDQDESPLEPIKVTNLNDVETWILVTPTVVVHKRDVEEVIEKNKEDHIDLPLEVNNGTVLFKREIIKPDQQPPVQVHIQNITESTEGSVQIVYVVLVGGRAVPAAVAARDMRLVRDAEVAKELGAVVTTKAEPAYLKAAEGLEGEAGSTGVHGTELWALAVGSTIAILLLLVILVLLCFAHKKKNLKSAASIRAYRNEMMREAERNQMKQINEDKDSKKESRITSGATPNKICINVPEIRKNVSKPSSPAKSATASARKDPGSSRMRQRFNELMDDAFTLFGSAASSADSHQTFTIDKQDSKESKESRESAEKKSEPVTQARNDNVRLPGSPYTALHVVRGRSAGPG